MTVAFFIAATVVATLQFLRVRERRLLPLMALFALTALGHSLPEGGWRRLAHLSAGGAGLVLVFALPERHRPPA